MRNLSGLSPQMCNPFVAQKHSTRLAKQRSAMTKGLSWRSAYYCAATQYLCMSMPTSKSHEHACQCNTQLLLLRQSYLQWESHPLSLLITPLSRTCWLFHPIYEYLCERHQVPSASSRWGRRKTPWSQYSSEWSMLGHTLLRQELSKTCAVGQNHGTLVNTLNPLNPSK